MKLYRHLLLFSILLLIHQTINAQIGKNTGLVSGPMLGFKEHRSVGIWLEVDGNAKIS